MLIYLELGNHSIKDSFRLEKTFEILKSKMKHFQQSITNTKPFSRTAQWLDHAVMFQTIVHVSGMNCFVILCGKHKLKFMFQKL